MGETRVIKKFIVPCVVALALSGCDQNLSTTVYSRDVADLLVATDAKSLPLDVEIEILELGIEKKCSTPEGAQLVEAVAALFQKASLIGCEKISGSMNDRMVIKATTTISRALTNDVPPGPYLVDFNIFKRDEPNTGLIAARFNAEKYTELTQRLTSINPMASINISSARITVKVNNDERSKVTLFPSEGTFANNDPVDSGWSADLEPRQEVSIKTGDVKTAFLVKHGWAAIGVLQMTAAP